MLRWLKHTTGPAVCAVAAVVTVLAVGCHTDVAWAVDVVNADKVPREIVINDSNGQSKIVTVPPREKLSSVCESCVVLSGNTSVEVTGKVIVKVENGQISGGSK